MDEGELHRGTPASIVGAARDATGSIMVGDAGRAGLQEGHRGGPLHPLLGHDVGGGHEAVQQVGLAFRFQALIGPHAPGCHLQLLLVHSEDILRKAEKPCQICISPGKGWRHLIFAQAIRLT